MFFPSQLYSFYPIRRILYNMKPKEKFMNNIINTFA